MTQHIKFESLLLESGWLSPAYISLDQFGMIKRISDQPDSEQLYDHIRGIALPGLSNAHSHAFQYAMA